ncbi:MAG: DUF3089 domain-containing protein [Bacteroidia bacterium]|nr:DUF3089 domain-containing protein [Bacteroidia bacterium]
MKTWTLLSFFILALAFFSCNPREAPKQAFSVEGIPSSPDYTKLEHWSAHPDKKDLADTVPRDLAALPLVADRELKADVFFIHPTTFRGEQEWNAALEDDVVNNRTDNLAIKHQASIFNAAGRVFAPRYRQMVLGGFYSEDKASMMKAVEVAYEDVKGAFEHYLENYNHGRPIILASHSQGTVHGIRLVKEFFDGKDLQDKLVCAYLIGWPIRQDTFKSIPVCNEPSQTGCVVGWCSWKKGKIPGEAFKGFYDDALVVNPINWKADGSYASKEMHKGLVGIDYKKIKDQQVDAQAHEGILWVSRPLPFVQGANYHIGDLNIFWLDVRKNSLERLQAFLDVEGSESKNN